MKFMALNQLDSLNAIPSEMLFASASGLDPDISPEAALLQVNRIAASRNFTQSQKNQLVNGISEFTSPRQFFCLGEKRVNVLLLNLYVDRIK
jgi:K+-transporting ATPase ATPase C chain